ncbi:MAG: Riboflavin synthase [Rhodospirillaceae bacterium]|jgi:riboflavin synthase|nr:MAG: Riboflavin synthase [Rhodospirillaceae bacterium]
MFTGIISAIGRIDDIQKPGDWRLKITTPWDCAKIDLGASIACSGVCLTVIERDADWFAVEVSAESLSRTTIGTWQAGTQINLERALRLGDELGGHIVSGHVDGLAIIDQITRSGDSHELKISVPDALSKFIAEKGSVSLDGISLTVNAIEGSRFGVNIIDHTWGHTTLGHATIGQHLNLEIDMLARYVSRLISS